MRVHLIYPNFKSGNAGGTQEPLGILTVASVLRAAGHDVSLTDMTFEESLDIIEVPVRKADVLGIGCSTPLFGKAGEILKRAKELNPSLFTIAGGPHATQDPEDALQSGFDVVVFGEAESSIVNLLSKLEAGEDWRSSKGLAYLLKGQLVTTPREAFVEDLDSIPFSSRDLINQRRYLARNGYVSIFNTRGCPFGCLYCKPMQNALFGQKCRKRSVKNVVDEIEQINKEYGAIRFYFKDDTLFLCGMEWFEAFRRELENRGFKIGWYCLGRVDQVKEPLLRCMKASGLEAIAFGVESGSQKILDFYRKGTTPHQTREAFRLCQKLGILTHAYIMLGAPEETLEDLEKTLKLFREIKPHSYRAFVVTPFPGNFLYEYAKERQIINVGSYEEFDNALNLVEGRLPMKLKHLTLKDIMRYSNRIRFAFFWSNVFRCMTSWKDFRLFLHHTRLAINIALQKL